MKIGVVIFPGSNCDRDTLHVFGEVLGQQVVPLFHKETDMQGVDMVVLPGGFSYGDYLRSGAIARFSPIMEQVIAHANRGGYLMGICNGFQILTEAKLVPGTLLHNESRKFICKNVFLKPQTTNTLLTQGLSTSDVLQVPIAHGEGNYYIDADGLKALNDNDQVLFRYCDAAGNITAESNPNGALDNIAGVTNKGRNVFGMMPHPERAAEDILSNTDGLRILESLLSLVK
ncbi:MAG: phosphoribosylformylglycinamidine synthase subunit PurQ [Sphingobacteriaceae bacterium]|nr:phosphoribosylformylglycinamidine synthase subunit PurQ [Sphingobacteriaceae bacterium]